jgi:hypothetical protein
MSKAPSSPESDPLDDLLPLWKVGASLPPRFQERVWCRISHEESQARSVASPWWTALARALARPAGATTCLAAFLLTGMALGYWGSEQYLEHTETVWRTAYLHSVTPSHASQHDP